MSTKKQQPRLNKKKAQKKASPNGRKKDPSPLVNAKTQPNTKEQHSTTENIIEQRDELKIEENQSQPIEITSEHDKTEPNNTEAKTEQKNQPNDTKNNEQTGEINIEESGELKQELDSEDNKTESNIKQRDELKIGKNQSQPIEIDIENRDDKTEPNNTETKTEQKNQPNDTKNNEQTGEINIDEIDEFQGPLNTQPTNAQQSNRASDPESLQTEVTEPMNLDTPRELEKGDIQFHNKGKKRKAEDSPIDKQVKKTKAEDTSGTSPTLKFANPAFPVRVYFATCDDPSFFTQDNLDKFFGEKVVFFDRQSDKSSFVHFDAATGFNALEKHRGKFNKSPVQVTPSKIMTSKVIVRNLTPEITIGDIFNLFGDSAVFPSIRSISKPTGRQGTAIVKFSGSSRLAITKNGSVVKGVKLSVGFAGSKFNNSHAVRNRNRESIRKKAKKITSREDDE